MKRVFDLLAAGLGLIFLWPVILLTAIAVRLNSPGPGVLAQRRIGRDGREFTCYKLRTMHQNTAQVPTHQVGVSALTSIGGFLRRSKLDELPQLLNVLRGDMSLVGPRPHAIGMKAAERDLAHIVAEYAHRHRVKPGITGWAQINGSRGPIETPAAVRERVKLDLDYVSRASLWLDLWIMLRTAPALLGDRKATR
jgi:lipopolysaccharide/colanic/teichoic acid biosynthesis glycosyltransferase